MPIDSFQKAWSRDSSLNGVPGGSSSGTVIERYTDTRSILKRNKKTDRWRPPSAYTRFIEEGDVYTFYGSQDARSGGIRQWGSGCDDCSGNYHCPLPTVPAYMESAAVTKALLQLKGQNVNYTQNIAERRQTASLVENTCIRLWRMVRQTRRTAAHLGTDPFNLWLELQYGWKPLLSDVHGVVKDLADGLRPEKVTVVGTAHDTFKATTALGASKFGPGMSINRVMRGRTDMKVRLDYVQIFAESNLRLLAQEGLTNPLDLAWEELPFSFVVDWFIPIGDFFNCLDASLGWHFLGGTKSVMQRMNYYARDPKITAPGFTGTATCQGKASVRKLDRSVYSSSPLPNPPFFNDRSSSMHVANGISLLGSAFTNSKRIIRL